MIMNLISHYSANILIVDDTPANLRLLSDMLKQRGFTPRPVPDGKLALRAMEIEPPDLILLDVNMPDMDGYELCRVIKANAKLKDIPVIFISASAETLDKVKAFTSGGVDYITKPFQIEEVYARIENHLRLRLLQIEHENTIRNLEALVQEQVKEISASQFATIFALAKLAESRDDSTGKHLERVRIFCKLLATHLYQHGIFSDQLSPEFIENIYHASPLHDIGKVGIPDQILLKPSRLTADEFEIMKRHTVVGAQTLEAVALQYPHSPLLNMGIEITRSHHERWDGGGYPDGLTGSAIPLSARIVAVADVYDALRSRRVYKPPFTHVEALQMIRDTSGCHFDPVIAEAFVEINTEFEAACEVQIENLEQANIACDL